MSFLGLQGICFLYGVVVCCLSFPFACLMTLFVYSLCSMVHTEILRYVNWCMSPK